MTFQCIEGCAFCCSPIPFKREILIKNREKQIRPVTKIFQMMNGDILAYTKEMKCIFLTENNKCNIYEDRPEICRTFGLNNKQSCPYLNTLGNRRESLNKIKQLEEQFKRRIRKMENQNG